MMNNKQAYVYTFTPNGGIKEYHGKFRKEKWDGNWMFDKDEGGYLTTVSPIEGLAFGFSVWFSEPNYEGAKKAFSERAEKLKDEYLAKAINQESHILKGHKRSKTDSVSKCPYCGKQFRMTTERYLSYYRAKDRGEEYAITQCRHCGKYFRYINVTPEYVRETGEPATLTMEAYQYRMRQKKYGF
jgi:phage terminase large subunit GpA-like protein